jgi:hypothetical protein
MLFFLIALGCLIGLSMQPRGLEEYDVGNVIQLKTERGDSNACASYRCSMAMVPFEDSGTCLLSCSNINGVCGGLGCPCVSVCDTYVQKYRAVGTYQLTAKRADVPPQTMTSYSKYQYTTEAEASKHVFATEALGVSGWFPIDEIDTKDNIFNLTDTTKHNVRLLAQKKNRLGICSGVFGVSGLLLCTGLGVG